MKTAKAHRFYDKPSIKKRAKSKAAIKYKVKQSHQQVMSAHPTLFFKIKSENQTTKNLSL